MRSATQQSEEAHVSGTANGNDLERRAEELRQIIARPSERELAQAELAKVERQRAEQKLADAVEAAHVRQTALRRAHGGQRAALTSLVERALAEALQFRKTCEQVAAAYAGLLGFEREDAALVDRLGVDPCAFPTVPAPSVTPEMVEAGVTLRGALNLVPERRPQELRGRGIGEHQIRERRNYEETWGTASHAIIEMVGLKEFPSLTPAQRQLLEAREREAAQWREQGGKMLDPSKLPSSVRLGGTL